MVFITGDTHGLQDFHKLHRFAGLHPELTKEDFMIVAGDFGAVWSEDTLCTNLRYYSDLPFTVLFVDGNHENFDLLSSYPEEEWHGGKVHRIRRDVLHLMRGQVFEIAGKTFFTFGGATSIDKAYRIAGRSWWAQEVPTLADLDEGLKNLKRYGNKVDYIVTHACGERPLAYPKLRQASRLKISCPEVAMLTNLENSVAFGHWYFGHYHTDAKLGEKYTALYDNIEEIAL